MITTLLATVAGSMLLAAHLSPASAGMGGFTGNNEDKQPSGPADNVGRTMSGAAGAAIGNRVCGAPCGVAGAGVGVGIYEGATAEGDTLPDGSPRGTNPTGDRGSYDDQPSERAGNAAADGETGADLGY